VYRIGKSDEGSEVSKNSPRKMARAELFTGRAVELGTLISAANVSAV
jgi:hypothetical protein